MRRDDYRRLGEQQKQLHAEMLELHESAEKENRSLSAEEQQEFDRKRSEFEELKERRSRARELFEAEQDVEQQLTTPIDKQVGEEVPQTFEEYRRQQYGIWNSDRPEVRAAYWRYLTVPNLSELDVEEQRALSRATGAAGNFLVPTDMYNEIIRALRHMGTFGALANEIVTDSGETINVPTNTAHGTATWTAENAAYTPSDETFGQAALGAHKAATKIIVSDELLEDAGFDLAGFLSREFGERVGVLEENAFINGSGTGQPQGVVAQLPVYTTANGNTTTVSYAELVRGIFTLPAQYRQNASFLVSDAGARNLYLMVDGQNRPLWNVNVAATGPDTFLGYPVYTHPNLPAPAASAKSTIFGDWRRVYTVRRVRGFSIQRQNELHSDNGQVGFRGQERVDGRVVLAEAGVAIAHSAV